MQKPGWPVDHISSIWEANRRHSGTWRYLGVQRRAMKSRMSKSHSGVVRSDTVFGASLSASTVSSSTNTGSVGETMARACSRRREFSR